MGVCNWQLSCKDSRRLYPKVASCTILDRPQNIIQFFTNPHFYKISYYISKSNKFFVLLNVIIRQVNIIQTIAKNDRLPYVVYSIDTRKLWQVILGSNNLLKSVNQVISGIISIKILKAKRQATL